MNWPRYLRALEAAEMERVEKVRLRQIEGKVKAEEVAADDWAAIQAHDAMLGEDVDAE